LKARYGAIIYRVQTSAFHQQDPVLFPIGEWVADRPWSIEDMFWIEDEWQAANKSGLGVSMSATDASEKIICSFCGKLQDDVRKMVVGPKHIFICDDCVYLSLNIISHEGVNLRTGYFRFELVAKLL
jgi:hypothetical protein